MHARVVFASTCRLLCRWQMRMLHVVTLTCRFLAVGAHMAAAAVPHRCGTGNECNILYKLSLSLRGGLFIYFRGTQTGDPLK